MVVMIEEGFVEVPLHPSGVYLLIREDRVVYVGQSVNVLQRLARHRYVLDASKRKSRQGSYNNSQVIIFDNAMVRFCRPGELNKLEELYIAKFNPECNVLLRNRQPVPTVKVDLQKLGFNPDGAPKKEVRFSQFDTMPTFPKPRMVRM